MASTAFPRVESIVDGQRVWQSGSGQAVVLLHGVGMDLSMWDLVAKRLEKRFLVVRYDMIGHGPARQPPPPYSLAMYVEQLSRVLQAKAVSAAGIVGFSMGSLVAEAFALAYPAKARWLVALNGVFNRSDAERAAVLERVASAEVQGLAAGLDAALDRWFTPKFREKNPQVVESVRRQLMTNDKHAFAAAYRVFGTADAELATRLGEIKCATLAMTGEFDQRSTPAMAEAVAKRVPKGRCVTLSGQRHLTPLEVPDQISDQIEAFLRWQSLL